VFYIYLSSIMYFLMGSEASCFLVFYHFVLIIVRLSTTTKRSIEPRVSSAIDECIISESSKATAHNCTHPGTPCPIAMIVRPYLTAVAQEPKTNSRSRVSCSVHCVPKEKSGQLSCQDNPRIKCVTHPVFTPIEAPIPIKTMNIAKAIVPLGGGKLPLSPRAKTTQMSTALAIASDKKAELFGSQG
jgi:hypothetical protein